MVLTLRHVVKLDAILGTFEESDHPRDESGRFSTSTSETHGLSSKTSGRTGQTEYEGGYGSKPGEPTRPSYYGWSDSTRSKLDACLTASDAQWDESKHPRGQPENKGQFSSSPGGGGGSSAAKPPGEGSERPATERSKRESAVKSKTPPTEREQTQAAEGVRNYLELVSGLIVEQSRGTARNFATPMITSGRQFVADDRTFAGPHGRPHQCYKNAANAAMFDDKLTYVEGYVTVHGVPIEHAWVVDREGRVVDPTIRDAKGIGGYYGVPIKTKYLERTLLRNKVYGVFGIHNPAVYDAAESEYVDERAAAAGRRLGADRPQRVPADASPAFSLFEQHETPSLQEFMRSVSPEYRRLVRDNDRKLRQEVPTEALVERGGHKTAEGKWTPERQRLHEKILYELLSKEKVAAARPPPGQQPTFTILGGRAGSGKSWATRPGAGPVDATKALVIDNDTIKQMLPEYKGYNASLLHEEASYIAERVIYIARQMKLNVVLDGTMRSLAPAQERLEVFKADGYRLEGHYVFAPPAVAARRALERAMPAGSRTEGEYVHSSAGRYVKPAYVLGSTSNERSFDGVRQYFDRWSVYDSTEDYPAEPKLKYYGGPDTDPDVLHRLSVLRQRAAEEKEKR